MNDHADVLYLIFRVGKVQKARHSSSLKLNQALSKALLVRTLPTQFWTPNLYF